MLKEPRVFNVIEGGTKFQLSFLPGAPAHVVLGNIGFRYPVPCWEENNILAFYDKLLHPPMLKDASETAKILTPASSDALVENS